MSERLNWYLAVAGILIFVTNKAVAQTDADIRWNVGDGLWTVDANWMFDTGEEAEVPSTGFDESAWIGNGGTAIVDSSVPDIVKLSIQNGTVLIQQGGSLKAVNTDDPNVPGGPSEIGRNGTLGLSGNGSLSTVDLENTGLIELNSAGSNFNVTGDLNHRGTLALNITSAGTPKVTVGGAAALAGTIAANFDNSVNLAFGDSFEFLSGASSVANNGARVVLAESVVLDVGLDVQLTKTNSTASLVVSNLPVLSVNRASGDAAIRNVVGGPVTMTGYAITSELGLLNPAGLAGLDAQGVEGWVAPNPLITEISEVNLTGQQSLAVDESLSLGKAYNGGATHPLDEDVAFQFVTPDGSVLDGLVEYLGPANDLVLNVDPDTGEVTIQNLSAFIDPVDLTGYSIISSSGALKPENWNSFADSGAAGGGWTEANPMSTTIAELNLFESKMFTNGTAISLGNIFDTSGERDLELQYTTADTLLSATVEYEPAPNGWDCNGDGVIDVNDANCTPAADINAFLSEHGFIAGDLDGNGSVAFPDFLVLSANFGSPGQYTDGDINKDDTVSFPDFLVLSANFGQSAAAAAAVPEPGGLTLLGLGGGLLLGLRRRRRLSSAVTATATTCAQFGGFLADRLASEGCSMKKATFSLGALCLLAILMAPRSLHAQIDLIAGEIIPITGPGDLVTLNQPENLVYTINVWGEDDRVIRGVEFLSDNENVNPDGIPGYRHDWTHNVTNWQGKPEFGDTVDDDEFEELMSDIRWTDNSPGNEFGVGSHLEVAANTAYTLQLLISGNHDENRIWDIFLDEQKVVDEFQSNNYEPHDPGVVWAYTHTFIAPDDELNITFRQGETGSDGNAILQGIILAIAGDVTPGDFNEDGAVDTADFQILLTNFHRDGVSFFDGDINFDRTVDIRDFAEFRGVFEAANAANAAIVPEPGALLSFAFGGAMLLGLYRYRRRLGYHTYLSHKVRKLMVPS